MQAAPEEPSPVSSVTNFLQEQQGLLSPHCISLLQTLPFQKSMNFTYVFQHHGFWYPIPFFKGLLSIQKSFKANPSDVILATFPKSGTTWLKATLFALLNRSKYRTNSTENDHPLLHNNPHDVVPFLETDLYKNDDQDPDLSGLASPRLFSTHTPFCLLPSTIESSACKIVYLCRNPKDTLISNWHFINKVRPEEKDTMPLSEAVDNFCRGINELGPFWDHAMQYWKASEEMPEKVMFVKYEEMQEQPCEQIRRLSKFLGCPFSEEEEGNGQVEEIWRLCSFNNLKGLKVNQTGKIPFGLENNTFFRKGKVGDSANYLTQEMNQRIDGITEEKFKGTMLKL